MNAEDLYKKIVNRKDLMDIPIAIISKVTLGTVANGLPTDLMAEVVLILVVVLMPVVEDTLEMDIVELLKI